MENLQLVPNAGYSHNDWSWVVLSELTYDFSLYILVISGILALVYYSTDLLKRPFGVAKIENRKNVVMIIELIALKSIPNEGQPNYIEFMADIVKIIGPVIKKNGGKIRSTQDNQISVHWKNVNKICPGRYVSTFFECQGKFLRDWKSFESKYDSVPLFKGAIHYGVQDSKVGKDYLGEVFQTLIRIVDLFSSISAGLLISEPLTHGLQLEGRVPEKLTDISSQDKKQSLGVYLIRS